MALIVGQIRRRLSVTAVKSVKAQLDAFCPESTKLDPAINSLPKRGSGPSRRMRG